MEHNGHARQKRNTYFVAHVQHDDKHEGEELGKEANNAHVAGLNVTEYQQDREDSGKERTREGESEQEREDNGRVLELEQECEQEGNEQLGLN